ncbi:MAG: amidase [Burkholderiaceae bacterium]
MDTNPAAYSIVKASAEIRVGRLTPLALVQDCLDQIKKNDSELHAFLTLTSEQALAEANRATREIRSGQWRGPMHGIPIAHKDVLMTEGVRTTAHSRTLENWIPNRDAGVVRLLKTTGAISLGKTACHEFAFGSPAPEDYFPAARNPWNAAHMPGSSSSGSAAAVAAGFCLAATGTDTGGSVRHPAAACGLVGLKPTRGILSTAGVIALAPSMDHVGLLTRTVGDSALVFRALVPVAASESIGEKMHRPVSGLRIGVARSQLTVQGHDVEVWSAFENSLLVLQSLGVKVVDLELPASEQVVTDANTVIGFEAHLQLQKIWREQAWKLGEGLRRRLETVSKISLGDYQQARSRSTLLRQNIDIFFETAVDAIVLPGRESAPETMATLMSNLTGQRSACNRLFSLTGHPALTLPMGLNSQGLPLALQIATAQNHESRLFQIAAAFEDALDWHSSKITKPWQRDFSPNSVRPVGFPARGC